MEKDEPHCLQRNLGTWKERNDPLPATETWRTVRERPESLMTQLREPQTGQSRSVSGQEMKISMEWG